MCHSVPCSKSLPYQCRTCLLIVVDRAGMWSCSDKIHIPPSSPFTWCWGHPWFWECNQGHCCGVRHSCRSDLCYLLLRSWTWMSMRSRYMGLSKERTNVAKSSSLEWRFSSVYFTLSSRPVMTLRMSRYSSRSSCSSSVRLGKVIVSNQWLYAQWGCHPHLKGGLAGLSSWWHKRTPLRKTLIMLTNGPNIRGRKRAAWWSVWTSSLILWDKVCW